jgi:hypothetical protein
MKEKAPCWEKIHNFLRKYSEFDSSISNMVGIDKKRHDYFFRKNIMLDMGPPFVYDFKVIMAKKNKNGQWIVDADYRSCLYRAALEDEAEDNMSE